MYKEGTIVLWRRDWVLGRSLSVIKSHLRNVEKSSGVFVELPIYESLCFGSTLLVAHKGLAHRLGEQRLRNLLMLERSLKALYKE